MADDVHVALLRGINVSGRNRIPMAELRAAAGEIGWADATTYIQSGNLVFRASGKVSDLEAALEAAIERRFGLSVPAIVRSAAAFRSLAAADPFPEESEREPNRVMLGFSKSAPAPGAVEGILERARHGERVVEVEGALWIHFPAGVGKTKVTSAVLDRAVGSTVTMRNRRTVGKLLQRMGDPTDG